jgi:hypothetical protein
MRRPCEPHYASLCCKSQLLYQDKENFKKVRIILLLLKQLLELIAMIKPRILTNQCFELIELNIRNAVNYAVNTCTCTVASFITHRCISDAVMQNFEHANYETQQQSKAYTHCNENNNKGKIRNDEH